MVTFYLYLYSIVSFDLHLSTEGHIHIYLANTEIDLSKLGISENIDITSKSLQHPFCSLQSMEFRGKKSLVLVPGTS